MLNIEKEIKILESDLYKIKQKLPYKDYIILSRQTNLSLEESLKLEQLKKSRTVDNFIKKSLYLKVLLNPIDETYEEKINYIIRNELDSKLITTFDYDDCFLDGVPIKLWVQSVIDFWYKNGLDENKKITLCNLYRYLYRSKDNGSLESKISYNLFVLRFALNLSIEDYLEKMGQKIYFWGDIRSGILNLKYKKSLRILMFLEELLNTETDSFTNDLIRNTISLLEAKNKEIIEKIKEISNSVKNIISSKSSDEKVCIDEKLLLSRFNEVKDYAITSDSFDISTSATFSDGVKMKSWWIRIRTLLYNNELESEISEVIRENIYQVLCLLTENKKCDLYKESSINYGPVFYRLFWFFDNILDDVFYKTGIPRSILAKLYINKYYPSEADVYKIIEYIKNISLFEPKYKILLDEATTICNSLLEEIKEKKINKRSYQVYSLINFVEYENVFKENFKMFFDITMLEKVKEHDYDWYVKAVTYYYICKTTDAYPSTTLYFDDGSIIYKWYNTQLRTSNGRSDCYEFIAEQEIVVKFISDLRQDIKERQIEAKDISLAIKNDFYKYYSALKEYIEKNKKLPDKEKIDNIYLNDIWNYLGDMIFIKETSLTNEQIILVKELRNYYIASQKALNKITVEDDFNFSYKMAIFLDRMKMSMPELAEKIGCSFAVLSKYSGNYNLPSYSSCDLFVKFLNNIDTSKYRDDQIADIEDFKNLILEIKDYRKKAKNLINHETINEYLSDFNVNFGNENDIYLDVPKEILDTIIKIDYEWFSDVEKISRQLLNDDDCTLSKFSWYLKEVPKIKIPGYLYEKKVLIKYLMKLNKKKQIEKNYKMFNYKIELLEIFITEFRRIPDDTELNYVDGSKGKVFFLKLRDLHYGFVNRYSYIEEKDKVRIKNLLQKAEISTRPNDFEEDSIVDINNIKIGTRLNMLRLSLGLSKPMFVDALGWSIKGMADIYNNRIPLTLKQINDLYKFVKNIDRSTLREDQIEDLDQFINIFSTMSLNSTNMKLKKVFSEE